MTASGSLRVQWGWLTWWCRRVLTRAAASGRRDSGGGSYWRPLRVVWLPLGSKIDRCSMKPSMSQNASLQTQRDAAYLAQIKFRCVDRKQSTSDAARLILGGRLAPLASLRT